jgi:helicase
MELVRQGLSTLHDVLYAGSEKLLEILKNSVRVTELLKGVAAMTGHSKNHMEAAHVRVADGLGIKSIVERCYQETGVEFEKAVLELLCATQRISASAVDDGRRQNVPDLFLKVGEIAALVECKAATKSPPLIGKEDAWAVAQKASDFDPKIRRVTLGKPAFDEDLIKKAATSTDVTLVESGLFIVAVLRVIGGEVTADQFMVWLTAPGVAELERLPGKALYSI